MEPVTVVTTRSAFFSIPFGCANIDRLAKAEVLDPNEVAVSHVFNRTVRRCGLIGDDAVSGKNFDHRKIWTGQYLRQLTAAIGIDLLGLAILSNHFHLILWSRPDVIVAWGKAALRRRPRNEFNSAWFWPTAIFNRGAIGDRSLEYGRWPNAQSGPRIVFAQRQMIEREAHG